MEFLHNVHFVKAGVYTKNMFMQLLINAAAFYVTAYLIPGITISGWPALLVIAIVWGILSVVIKPILLILTLPINILTLGLFTLVINALLILMTSSLVPGFKVDGFGTALFAAIVLAIVSGFLNSLKQ
jgi:putative membrane protein